MSLLKSLPYFVIVLVFSLFGQALLRKGVTGVLGGSVPAPLDFVRTHLLRIVLSPEVLAGAVLCGIGVLAYLYVLAAYEVSRALPIMGALGYVGMFVIGRVWLKEQATWTNFAGILLIIAGLYLVSLKAA
jgi:multidrug transporter EmrE-like cation transporter